MTETATAAMGKVIVGVDGSPSSLDALRQGHRMAGMLGTTVVAVSTWHQQHGLFPPVSYHPQQDCERDLRISIREAFRPAMAPEMELLTLKGDPAGNLVDLSAGAELLVLGSRGHSGIVGTVLGSVSSECAARSHCPVLVVNGTFVAPAARSDEAVTAGAAG